MKSAHICTTLVLVVGTAARLDLSIFWPYGTYIDFFPRIPWYGYIYGNIGHHIEDKIAPRKITMKHHKNGSVTYHMLAITDMDRQSTAGAKKWTWRAVTRRGKLTLSADKRIVSVVWMKNSDKNITSGFNNKGRGMELSDLSQYNGHLLAPDDKTGMLYEIKGKRAIPWVFLNSGPGNSTEGMKVEWLTIKDGKLYAGGHGCEYRNKSGHIVSEDPMWIKVITKSGQVTSKNWKSIYRRMRKAAGYPAPGYLTHEAVQWSSIQEMWYFLPRKASHTAYNETEDEKKGTNLLILAERSLKDFFVVHIGNETHTERGFSAFDFIPGTKDKLMVALKTEEVHGKPTKSYFTVFSLNGTVLLPDQELDDGYKFEGIYFV